VEIVADFILGGSKITADGDCSHEIKRRLLLGRKVMTNLDSILKSRDITLPTKLHLVKAMVFPGVMYGCESWTVKKAEHPRIDAFNILSLCLTFVILISMYLSFSPWLHPVWDSLYFLDFDYFHCFPIYFPSPSPLNEILAG